MPGFGKFKSWWDQDTPGQSVAVSRFSDGTAIVSTQRIGDVPVASHLTGEQVQELIQHLTRTPDENDDTV